MNPVEITSLLGVVVAALSSVVIPVLLRRRDERRAATTNDLVSWQGITSVLQKERDQLRAELTVSEDQYKARLRSMEADYRQQMDLARARITQLEAVVADLSAKLYQYRQQHPSGP